jgi:hypothetical protein
MPRCFYHRLTTFTSTTRYGYFLPGSSRELRGVVYPYERPGSAIDPGVKSTGFFMMRLTSTVSLHAAGVDASENTPEYYSLALKA